MGDDALIAKLMATFGNDLGEATSPSTSQSSNVTDDAAGAPNTSAQTSHTNDDDSPLMPADKSFNVNAFLAGLDAIFDAHEAATKAGPYLEQAMVDAENAGDDAGLLTVLNETMGFYRSQGRHKENQWIIQRALELAARMGIENTDAWTTTLINAATGMRAAGQYEQAENLYKQAQASSERTLAPNDRRLAALHNNLSMVYSETGRTHKSELELREALRILESSSPNANADIDVATTNTNLALTLLSENKLPGADWHAAKALEIYHNGHLEHSAHYASALAGYAQVRFRLRDFSRAVELYSQALKVIEQCYGKDTDYYRITAENLRQAEDAERTLYSGTHSSRTNESSTTSESNSADSGRSQSDNTDSDNTDFDNTDSDSSSTESDNATSGHTLQTSTPTATNHNTASTTQVINTDASSSITSGTKGEITEAGTHTDTSAAAQHNAAQYDPSQHNPSQHTVQPAQTTSTSTIRSGLQLAKAYWNTYGKPMIAKNYPEYQGRIAVGLVGHGSECYGFDDAISRDHDFAPRFCIWLTDEDYAAIGERLQADYESLPATFMGFGPRKSTVRASGSGRRDGVFTISGFFESITGYAKAPDANKPHEWLMLDEATLAAATNGEVFADPLGAFLATRQGFKTMPDDVRIALISKRIGIMAQAGQYNVPRMLEREDGAAAWMSIHEFTQATASLVFLINNPVTVGYLPYYKWTFAALRRLSNRISTRLADVCAQLETLLRLSSAACYGGAGFGEGGKGAAPAIAQIKRTIEDICGEVVVELKRDGLTSSNETFLEWQRPYVEEHIHSSDACLHSL